MIIFPETIHVTTYSFSSDNTYTHMACILNVWYHFRHQFLARVWEIHVCVTVIIVDLWNFDDHHRIYSM